MTRRRVDSFDDWKYAVLDVNDQAILSPNVVPDMNDEATKLLHKQNKTPKGVRFAVWPGSSRVIGKWFGTYGEMFS